MKNTTSILPKSRLWTVYEYYWMSDLGILSPEERTELIDGEIMQMAAKKPAHSAVNKRAADYLRNLLAGIADIRVQEPIHLSDISEPEPDIAVVRINSRDYINRHPIPEEAFLVIEVADATLNYDRKKKAASYAKAGIADYWVIDVKKQEVHVFREPGQKSYEQKSVLGSNDNITPIAFPEVNVFVKDFFP